MDCLGTSLHGLAFPDCKAFAIYVSIGPYGDGKHLVVECPAMQDLRDEHLI